MSRVTAKTWLDRLCGFGLILYPFIAHICFYFHSPIYAVAWLMLLFIVFVVNSASRNFRRLHMLLAVLVLLGMIFWARFFDIDDWLYLPPVVLPLWVSFYFLSSLGKHDQAIISRIASRIEGAPLDPAHLLYTRHITLLWGVVLAGMSVEAVLLAWLTSTLTWSWWVHIGNYIILLSLILVELPVRWIRFGKPPQFGGMLKAMLERPWLNTNRR